MKILLVEDCQEDRELIQLQIKNLSVKEDVKIEEVNNLTSCIRSLKKDSYDVVILDLSLPETDGMKTIEKVYKVLKINKKDIPIIILTGNEDYNIGKTAFDFGVKDFLVKGTDNGRDLLRAINFATYNRNLPSKTHAI